jgi:hypothetical protein
MQNTAAKGNAVVTGLIAVAVIIIIIIIIVTGKKKGTEEMPVETAPVVDVAPAMEAPVTTEVSPVVEAPAPAVAPAAN